MHIHKLEIEKWNKNSQTLKLKKCTKQNL